MQFMNMFEAPASELYFPFVHFACYIVLNIGSFKTQKVQQLHDKDYGSSLAQQHVHVHV
jgi:hypothetical protein